MNPTLKAPSGHPSESWDPEYKEVPPPTGKGPCISLDRKKRAE